ncbi:unnamed protein product [Coregonus sp. 'balchen']|nr:unnamed protein product [Coregonus sp. 'balchen']
MVSILGQCGSALTNVLQSKFGCTTVLHGVDATCVGAGQSRKPSVFPEERFSIHLSKSFKVSTDLNLSTGVEKVENSTLNHLSELKKRQLQPASSQRMYQRLPAQYCDLVSRVGFQREFAPPDEQMYGEGIYFSSSVHGTEKLWRGLADEEYLYFIEAQMLTGKSTIGSPGLIVPPETPGGDPLSLYDSVNGVVGTCVIFNVHQALPEYLIICNNKKT